jgi:hypothetical protein
VLSILNGEENRGDKENCGDKENRGDKKNRRFILLFFDKKLALWSIELKTVVNGRPFHA